MTNEVMPAEPVDLLRVRHDLGQTIELGVASPEECLQIYKMLGPHRSMPKIFQYLKNQGRKSPAVVTMKKWATKHNWKFHIDTYDREVANAAEARAKEEYGAVAAEEIGSLATQYRKAANKLIRKIATKIDGLKLMDGSQIKAAVEATVALSKAAEVMDGGVSDRTENREVLTIEERRTKAQQIVDAAFKQFNGQDNGRRTTKPEQPVGDAANARTGTDGV